MTRTIVVVLALASNIAFGQAVPDHPKCYRP
jgi:hypothetical protein